jgi:hypothetical protein
VGDVRLEGDTRLVGIDYRVQNGKLYGVGEKGGIYVLDPTNARSTEVGRLSVPLDGRFFGVDFNPAANALRITSDTGQNLRQPFAGAANPDAPNGATVVDGPLTNPAAPPATGTTPAKGISGSAYTNNDLDPARGRSCTTSTPRWTGSTSSPRPTPARSLRSASCASTPARTPASTSTAPSATGAPSPCRAGRP